MDLMPDFTISEVRLDLHSSLPGIVVAHYEGATTPNTKVTDAAVAAILAKHGFRHAAGQTMLLSRIDYEEPYYAHQAAIELRNRSASVHISRALQQEINAGWVPVDLDRTWLSTAEIRETGTAAQMILEDIYDRRLVILGHALDGHTRVAVGAYGDGRGVHLHGQDQARHESLVFESEDQALLDFRLRYGDAVRYGPAAPTTSEQRVLDALAHTSNRTADSPTNSPRLPEQPAPNEAALAVFFDEHPDWEKYRTGPDEVTIANHESLTARIEFTHEAASGTTAWTIAGYESPVGPRTWYATISADTPPDLVLDLLDGLADHLTNIHLPNSTTSFASADPRESGAQASTLLVEAGWQHTQDGRGARWHAPDGSTTEVRFDHIAAYYADGENLVWSVSGTDDRPRTGWSIQLSQSTPAPVLHTLVENLVHLEAARKPPAAVQATRAPGASRSTARNDQPQPLLIPGLASPRRTRRP
ncbi:DUF317 domain-containing protein [Streptomyces sp. NPDC051561]|uniref:DUF317 domain-containing protein n=1 Tax=Streptomyces sp. NPDC051561 TaxID=3365658 RepID=UPI0037ACF816